MEDIIRYALQRPGPVLLNIFIHDLDYSMQNIPIKYKVSILDYSNTIKYIDVLYLTYEKRFKNKNM